jgi:Uma2 family endonuclease
MQLSLPDDLVVHIHPTGSSDAIFEEICGNHPELRIEQTREGEILIMSPAGNESSNRNLKILRQLGNWTLSDGRGEAFDSNTVFRLPDGSKMGPDAAWISRARLAAFPAGEREKFLPLCFGSERLSCGKLRRQQHVRPLLRTIQFHAGPTFLDTSSH